MKIALLAGTHSGCGKTTVMLALLQYLQQRHTITAFKAGPDFLDPLWHQAVIGKPSYNLDTRMIGVAESRLLLAKQSLGTELVLIEGVMGLFDGRAGVGEDGSTADLAKVLDIPVILVVDTGGMSGSIVPLVSGFCHYAENRGVHVVGVIANRVGSEHHAGLLRQLLKEHGQPPLLAWLEKNCPALPERHLGLMRPEETQVPDLLPFFHVVEADIMPAFAEWKHLPSESVSIKPQLQGKTLAIARDAACCFIYPANLDWLREQGVELQFFSLLAGDKLPEHIDAVWLPGGYPELYAEQLSHSASWPGLRQFIERGGPLLAECGGMMLLGRELIDHQGKHWAMAEIFPYVSRMQPKLAALGYRQDNSGVTGHEFHHSTRENDQHLEQCFKLERGDKGVRYKNVRASYIHWYFPSAAQQIVGWFS